MINLQRIFDIDSSAPCIKYVTSLIKYLIDMYCFAEMKWSGERRKSSCIKDYGNKRCW